MNTEVVLIEKTNALEIFTTVKGLDPVIEKIKAEIKAFVPDITTAKGRKEIGSMAYKVSQSKTHIEKVGKELADELKRQPKLISEESKRVRIILEGLRDEVRKPLTDWENIEKIRVANHEEFVITIKNLPLLIFGDKTSADVKRLMENLEGYRIDESLEEFQEPAQAAYNATKLALMESLKNLEESEAAEVERARLTKEAELKAQADHDAEIKRVAEAAVRAEADLKAEKEKEDALLRERKLEQEKKQAELDKQKAEQDKVAAEEKAKQDIARAEQDRIDEARRVEALREQDRREAEANKAKAIEAERQKAADENSARERARLDEAERVDAENKAREEDKEHRKKINNKVLEVLTSAGISREVAITVITLAASNKAYNLKVIY